ncbi:type III effector Hrp-dependent outer domain-containing protein [Cohnella xylanilytica]|uniref:four-carbon acid sugar kinase family protein n=1 Tax=Cohnella xylanilytica TaxID=557555 RepID=UPI001B2C2786|nr:four-carbon acid sugar kinase family protein [Cohnella xylanilytica]GIO14972.1 type III effector Hrp-dependent outer domain-containing protein [Cohnella xylanilytica]
MASIRNRNEGGGGRGERPLIGYYGDDFTGSTDVLEALFRQGLRTVLFLDPPEEGTLSGIGPKAKFADLDAFGVAGVGRSLSPEEMERELPPIFDRLKQADPVIVHYKICSTFDSSPGTGSIGKAAELGRSRFGGRFVPLLAGVPYLGRYTVFGHHFAASPDGEVHRLDRHPTMSRHPATPMDESDLRKHLAKQTALNASLMDIAALDAVPEVAGDRLEKMIAEENPDLVLFDVLDERRLAVAGELIWREARRQGGGLFVIGSSGVEYALGAAWRASGRLPPSSAASGSSISAKPVDRLLVVSGSCSPATAKQIAEAEEDGFVAIRVPACELIRPGSAEETRARLLAKAKASLDEGCSVILYSARGPDDPSIGELRRTLAELGLRPEDSSRLLGAELGGLARALAVSAGLSRILIAGGDTSGYVARALGIYALECRQTLAPGVPLCRAYSEDEALDGLELVLKGGQVGGERFFQRAKRGGGEIR